jgi:hypothetical protein
VRRARFRVAPQLLRAGYCPGVGSSFYAPAKQVECHVRRECHGGAVVSEVDGLPRAFYHSLTQYFSWWALS